MMEQITKIISQATNLRVYFIKKTRGRGNHTAVIFPNAINNKIKENYQENFLHFTDGKGVREYDGVHQETDTIQKVSTHDLEEWIRIRDAISNANENNIFLTKDNFSDDYSLIVLLFEKSSSSEIQLAYLVAKYRKIDTWYKKSIKYAFMGRTLREIDQEIYILNGCIDAAIIDGDTYILMPNNFESIFNYYKKSIEIVESNRENIEGWIFLSDSKKFYNYIQGKKRATLRVARILKKSLATLNSLTPHEIKEKLIIYEEFKDLQYDENDRIIVSAKTRDLIIDILLNVYVKNLFNDELVYTKGM